MAVNNKKDFFNPQQKEKERIFISDIYSSKQYLKVDKTLATHTLLKQTKGVGIIKQILLKSNSTTYSIQLIVDNETVWDNAYAFFLANTADIADISAYAAGGKNFLSIQHIYFQKDFQFRIRPIGSIIWDILLIRYDIRKETMLKEY